MVSKHDTDSHPPRAVLNRCSSEWKASDHTRLDSNDSQPQVRTDPELTTTIDVRSSPDAPRTTSEESEYELPGNHLLDHAPPEHVNGQRHRDQRVAQHPEEVCGDGAESDTVDQDASHCV